MTSYKEKIDDIIKNYGKLAIITHIGLCFCFYGAALLVIKKGVDTKRLINFLRIYIYQT